MLIEQETVKSENEVNRNSVNDKGVINQLSPAVCFRHGNLLSQTKIAVKRVMEEAVTKKFIYFNNSTVSDLCVAVDNCLLDGLQRRSISLFEDFHSIGLLKKVSKDCEAALYIVNKINSFSDHASGIVNGRSVQDGDTTQKSSNSMSLPMSITGLFNKPKQSSMKYLWIKLALVDKKLLAIIEYVMQHCQQYYEDNSIMSSYLSGSLFVELIAGPCSLDFSLVKPSEHIWNDPDALELLDRHMIHSVNSWPSVNGQGMFKSRVYSSRSLKSRPYLKMQHHVSPLQMHGSKFISDMASLFNIKASLNDTNTIGSNVVAKEYVESLHQNMKHVLLYGKNNVLVQPREDLEDMQGYLSLHVISGDRLRLHWTPNQLMNYQTSQEGERPGKDVLDTDSPRQIYRHSHDSGYALHSRLQWDCALSIKMENIVSLHCHNHEQDGGKVTLVRQDGVQHPPLHFPAGGHLLQFLTCLENGLMPSGRLEPPLLQLNDAEKTFPKRHRRQSNENSIQSEIPEHSKPKPSFANNLLNNLNRSIRRRKTVPTEDDDHRYLATCDNVTCNNCDFVFKVVYSNKDYSGCLSCGSSREEPHSAGDQMKEERDLSFPWNSEDSSNDNYSSINTLCLVMKQQILSRAFYGWLQHYRNIKTVRTQFNTLVQSGSVQSDVPSDASEGLTAEIWNEYKMCKELNEKEIYRLIYFGGCVDSIRREVWPRILGHYDWSNFTTTDIDCHTEVEYERSLSQWKALEVIVRQRENESMSGSGGGCGDTESMVVMENDCSDGADHETRRESIVNMSNCDVNPSVGFYSSDNIEDTAATLSRDQDLTFKEEILTCMADNMHRIDKDVDRCDRNHPYFSSHGTNRLKGKGNLRKLRNIMVTWVWEHADIGYVQGMCDLLAPLLVVMDNESLTHACFTKLMQTMIYNFPQIGSKMDDNLSTMSLLLQIIDRDLYDHMCPDGEITSLYVSYRWFLLDFKRELCYSDVFCVWETIWSARQVASDHFNLFLALSLLQYYRDIILDNTMEYTDIIKFYNEMAEKHQVQKLLYIARKLIESIQDILQSR